MKLYAATNEYGNINAATIRSTLGDCIAAAIAATVLQDGSIAKTESDIYAVGICIAEFEDNGFMPMPPVTATQSYDATCTYLKGGRAGQVVASQASKATPPTP
jgi:hypothetical protein